MDPYQLNRPLSARGGPQEPAKLEKADINQEISWSEGDWIRSMIAYGGNPDPVVRRKGIQIYKEMMEDDQIKACIEIRKQSRLSTPWNIVSADDASTEANKYRDYILHCFERMESTLENALYEIYSAIEHGFSISEIIFEIIPDGPFEGLMGIKAIKTRDPLHYDFKTDVFGNLLGIVYSGVGANLLPASGGSQPTYGPMQGQSSMQSGFGNNSNPFPKDKFIIYSYNSQFNNFYGRSDLLAAYRSWLSKKHVMKFWNIWLERYAAPFPVITVDPDQIQKKGVMTELDNFIKNLSAKAGIRVPKGVTIDLKEGQAARAAVYTEAINTHNKLISHAILVPNLLGFTGDQGSGGSGGSYGLGSKQFDAFYWVLDKMGRDTAEDIVGEQIIKRLLNLSFPNVDPKLCPRFKYEEINEESITARATILTTLANGGFVSPDEEWVREFLTIPKKDPNVELPTPKALLGPFGGGNGQPTPDDQPAPEKAKPAPADDKGGKLPVGSTAEPNKPGKDLQSNIKFVERAPNKFETKIMVKDFEQKVNALEKAFYISIEAEMVKIMDKVISWVEKKDIIANGNPKAVHDMPMNVSDLKETLRNWLIKIHLDSKLRLLEEVGRSGVKVEITKKFADTQAAPFEPWEPLPPTEAITFFNKKVNAEIVNANGIKTLLTLAVRKELSYYDAKAFSISGIVRDDILNDAKSVILNAIKRQDLTGGIKDLKSLFTKYVDTGLMVDGELLTPGRLYTIVRTNMGEAINEGRRAMMEDPDVAGFVDYWLYSAIIDDRTCFPSSTMVQYSGGSKKISDILPGELVVSGDGNLNRVITTFRRTIDKWLTLHLENGRKLRLSEHHKILVRSEKTLEWKEARECNLRDYVFAVQGLWQTNLLEKRVLWKKLYKNRLVEDKEKEKGSILLQLWEDIYNKAKRSLLFFQMLSGEKKGGLFNKRLSLVQEKVYSQRVICQTITKLWQVLFSRVLENETKTWGGQKADFTSMRKMWEAFSNWIEGSKPKNIFLLNGMSSVKKTNYMPNVPKKVSRFSKQELLLKSLLPQIIIQDEARSNSAPSFRTAQVRMLAGIFDRQNDGGFLHSKAPSSSGSGWNLLAPKSKEGREKEKCNHNIGTQLLESGVQERVNASPSVSDGVIEFSSKANPSKIVSITTDYNSEFAYDLQVENEASYIAENIIVHNSDYCLCMDGKQFRMEDLPLLNPSAHYNCRSISVPISKFEVERNGVEVSEPCPGRALGFTDIKREPIQIPDIEAMEPPKPIDVAKVPSGSDLPPAPRSAKDIANEQTLREEMSQLITRCPYTACWSDKIHITGGKFNIAEFVCDKCAMPFRVSSKGDLYLYDAGVDKWERTTLGLMPQYFKDKIRFRSIRSG